MRTLHCKRFAKDRGILFLVCLDKTHSVASNNYHLVISWCPEPDVLTVQRNLNQLLLMITITYDHGW